MQNGKCSQPNFVSEIEKDRHFKYGSSSADYTKASFYCKSKKLSPSRLRENRNLVNHILGNLTSGRTRSRCLDDIKKNTSRPLFRCFPPSWFYSHTGSSHVAAKMVPIDSRFASFQLSTPNERRTHFSQ